MIFPKIASRPTFYYKRWRSKLGFGAGGEDVTLEDDETVFDPFFFL